MPFSTIFQFIVAVSFIGGGNRSTWIKPQICHKSLTNFITYSCIEFTSPWEGFELTTLLVIGTDCTSSCKYSYHTITTMTAPSTINNQRLPGACNRSPGSKLLSITTQLHCGGHLGGRVWLPDTILEEDHPMIIPSKFGSNWATGSRQDGFYVKFPWGPMLN
jgi:hypothetical protein